MTSIYDDIDNGGAEPPFGFEEWTIIGVVCFFLSALIVITYFK